MKSDSKNSIFVYVNHLRRSFVFFFDLSFRILSVLSFSSINFAGSEVPNNRSKCCDDFNDSLSLKSYLSVVYIDNLVLSAIQLQLSFDEEF